MEQHERAIAKFKDAAKLCGYNSELFYNIALAYYEMGIYSEAYYYLETIIRRAYEMHPKLRQVTVEDPVFEKSDKAKAQQVLRETAIVEALNLKASILYSQGDRVAAMEVAKTVPVIQQESGPDPVTYHKLAVFAAPDTPEDSL